MDCVNTQDDFVASYKEVQVKFSRFYACILHRVDLTLPQYALLNYLANSEPMTMTEASAKLHITKPAITHLVDKLEKKKCLKRQPHKTDRRIYLLEVTLQGRKVTQEMQSHILGFMLQTFNQFDRKEKKIVSRFYSLLSQTMEEVLAESKDKTR